MTWTQLKAFAKRRGLLVRRMGATAVIETKTDEIACAQSFSTKSDRILRAMTEAALKAITQ